MLKAKKQSGFKRLYEWSGAEEDLRAHEFVLSDKQRDLVESMIPACWEAANKFTPTHFQKDPDKLATSFYWALEAVTRAAILFEEDRGWKFSTFAYMPAMRAVWSNWSGLRKKADRGGKVYPLGDINSFDCAELVMKTTPDPKCQKMLDDIDSRDELRSFIQALEYIKKSDSRSYTILCHRHCLQGFEWKSLEDLAEEFSLSKERIRQIQVSSEKKICKLTKLFAAKNVLDAASGSRTGQGDFVGLATTRREQERSLDQSASMADAD